jgi:hypothetical protein
MMRSRKSLMCWFFNQSGKVHTLKKLSTSSSYFTASNFPKEVTIVEVGPRDGLQNEKV